MDEDRLELERLVGRSIVDVERAVWGFTNRTDVVTLADGSRVVVQRYASRLGAAHRLQVTGALADPLSRAGVRIPQLLRSDLEHAPPYALLELLPGVPPQVVAGADLSAPVFSEIAAGMGELVRKVSAAPTAGLRLPSTWASPDRLVRGARRWLAAVQSRLTEVEQNAVTVHIAAVPLLCTGRPTVLAHGDFGPTNVLVHNGAISGLLDWEFARLADPLFDVAWWAWLLRFHNPASYERSWPAFAAAAQIDRSDPVTSHRIRTLQVLRVLEATVHFAYRGEQARDGWTRRLQQTLTWPVDQPY